jgi:hypothetical protein
MPRVESATLLPIGAPRIGSVLIDCALSETHTWASSVTRVPVESGSIRSQHIVKAPYVLTIEAVISEIPTDPKRQQIALSYQIAQSRTKGYFDSIPGARALANQGFEKLDPSRNAASKALGPFNPSRAVGVATATRGIALPKTEYSQSDEFQVALSRLLELRESDTPFDYISPLGVVSNLVFENLEIPVDQTGDLLFRARLVEFVETGLTRSRSLAVGQEDASQEPANIGSRTTAEADFQDLLNS